MIARIWKGLAKSECSQDYIKHLKNDTLVKLEAIEGFSELKVLHTNLEKGTEFIVITIWEDLKCIEKFADKPIDKAVVPVYVRELMISYDSEVLHYDISD